MKVERLKPIRLEGNTAIKYAVAMAEKQFQYSVKEAKYLGGGSFGRAVSVKFNDGKTVAIKFLLVDGMLKKETYDLSLISKYCTVKMPEVLFVHYKDNEIPVDCYGMEFMNGKPLFFDLALYFKGKKKKLKLAEEIVDGLHSIHTCTSDKFGDTMNPSYDTWQECYRPFAEQVLSAAERLYRKGELSYKIYNVMNKAWQKFDVIFEEDVEKACLIHGDLNVVNIMVNKRHGLSGFIDPLNSMYADCEYDLFQFYNLTGKWFHLGEVYKSKYGVSKRFEQKMAFYGLWNEVYCYIKSGVLIGLIMNPLVKNMRKRLLEL